MVHTKRAQAIWYQDIHFVTQHMLPITWRYT